MEEKLNARENFLQACGENSKNLNFSTSRIFFAFRFAEKKNQSEINLANVSNKVFLCKIVYWLMTEHRGANFEGGAHAYCLLSCFGQIKSAPFFPVLGV